jgi:hypothetical protein
MEPHSYKHRREREPWKGKGAYMLSHAKVRKFDFTIRAHKYVRSFNISGKKKQA